MFRLATLAAAFALTLAGADLTGIWTGQVQQESDRDPADLSFRFTQRGNTFSGKMYTDNESLILKDAKLEGSHISFTVTTELNGQVNKFIYAGEIHDNEIELGRIRESNKDKKDDKPASKVLVRLRRLA